MRKTLLDRFRVSDDEMMVGFTVDIGGTEHLTAGFKDLRTNQFLPHKLESVGQLEFGEHNTVYYTQCDEFNRPYKVQRLDLGSGQDTCIFTDANPTHYIDLNVTKDKRFLIINSATKEESEVWVLERSSATEQTTPVKLLERRAGVTAHLDHLNDFFVTITNADSSKAVKIQTL